MIEKLIRDSLTQMTEIVLPNDANPLGYLRGGRLIDWMDIASEITAQRHCGRLAVTASVDHVSFHQPIRVGDIVTVKAYITRAFGTSMEIMVEVTAENIPKGVLTQTNHGIFTFVAIDEGGKPVQVPMAVPESPAEIRHYNQALDRRMNRSAAFPSPQISAS